MRTTLPGERVTLRPLAREDAEDVVRWRSDPEVHAEMFSASPPTLEEHLRWFATLAERDDRVEFVIIENGSGRPVGTIGLSSIDRRNRRAEYGIMVGDPGARGRGIGSEASQLLLAYAFRELGLHRVYLHVFQENEPAIRLYSRLGFATEGILRHHAVKDGRFRDIVVMGIFGGGEE
jgi:UDP-4-amino-4,6-dideoxy-N-acetyl-beta-L-altrosamine N-acetyltransferase